jgi:polyribonucleotide nucleotidyltransferase
MLVWVDAAGLPFKHETEVTLLEGPEIQFSEAVIDNGRFGKRVIRFETGRLAKQAAGAAMVYIDEETALLSATTAGKHRVKVSTSSR